MIQTTIYLTRDLKPKQLYWNEIFYILNHKFLLSKFTPDENLTQT